MTEIKNSLTATFSNYYSEINKILWWYRHIKNVAIKAVYFLAPVLGTLKHWKDASSPSCALQIIACSPTFGSTLSLTIIENDFIYMSIGTISSRD